MQRKDVTVNERYAWRTVYAHDAGARYVEDLAQGRSDLFACVTVQGLGELKHPRSGKRTAGVRVRTAGGTCAVLASQLLCRWETYLIDQAYWDRVIARNAQVAQATVDNARANLPQELLEIIDTVQITAAEHRRDSSGVCEYVPAFTLTGVDAGQIQRVDAILAGDTRRRSTHTFAGRCERAAAMDLLLSPLTDPVRQPLIGPLTVESDRWDVHSWRTRRITHTQWPNVCADLVRHAPQEQQRRCAIRRRIASSVLSLRRTVDLDAAHAGWQAITAAGLHADLRVDVDASTWVAMAGEPLTADMRDTLAQLTVRCRAAAALNDAGHDQAIVTLLDSAASALLASGDVPGGWPVMTSLTPTAVIADQRDLIAYADPHVQHAIDALHARYSA